MPLNPDILQRLRLPDPSLTELNFNGPSFTLADLRELMAALFDGKANQLTLTSFALHENFDDALKKQIKD